MPFKHAKLDFYDDGGTLLKSLCTESHHIPEFVKQAHVMTGVEDSDLYALVVHDNNDSHKKFPIIDAGNTWLSSLYFAKNMEKLSHEGKVIAATHLKEACEYFDIPIIEDIDKLASDNYLEYNQTSDAKPEPIAAPVEVIEDYAISSHGRQQYPLHNLAAVTAADNYFSQHHARLEGSDRREYAVKVASVAEQYSIPLGDAVLSYSTEADWGVIGDHLATRYAILKEVEAPPEYRDGLVKIASAFEEIGHDKSAKILEEFDIQSGLDRFWDTHISDPYRTFFNMEKTAMGLSREKATITVGTDTVTEDALENLSKDVARVKEQFGQEFASSFAKNPLQLFQSMPLPQKKILARMAEDSIGSY